MKSHPLGASFIAAVLAVLCFAATAQAKTAMVYLNDRPEPLRGELVSENDDRIVLKIAGIDTPIPRDRIRRIEFDTSLAEQYQKRRAEVDDDDIQARFELARWLFNIGTGEGDRLARQELAALVEAEPDHRAAKLLLKLVEQRIANRADDGSKPENGDADRDDERPHGDGDALKKLTDEQVNLIKVMEVDLNTQPRVLIPKPAIAEFLDKYHDQLSREYQGSQGRKRFRRLEGYEQLREIFRLRATEFYDDAIVRDEPEPLKAYRQGGAALVANYCGRCHGGDAAGLRLFTRNPNSQQTAYTNLLILHRTQVGGRPMIDRHAPRESLLLQYALPRDEAKFPHPQVQGFNPYFRSTDDRRFTEAVEWIGKLYREARYPVEYEVPKAPGAAEDQPPRPQDQGGGDQAPADEADANG